MDLDCTHGDQDELDPGRGGQQVRGELHHGPVGAV